MGSPIDIRIILPNYVQIENHDRKLVVAAHGDGRGIHHAQGLGQHFEIADFADTARRRDDCSGSLS